MAQTAPEIAQNPIFCDVVAWAYSIYDQDLGFGGGTK